MKRAALILEDEALIAVDLETALEKAGFEVVTLVSCSDADAWLESHRPALAIVDVQLRDGNCEPAVTKLNQIGTSFIIHSGEHEEAFIGTVFAKGKWVGKPSPTAALIDVALQLLPDAALK